MRKWWLVLMIVAMLATACGGSDSDSDVAANGSSSSSDSDSDDGDDAGSADGGSDGSDDSSEPADDGDGDEGDDDGDDEGDDDGDDEPDPDFSGSDSDDFCRLAREYDENNPLDNLSPLDGERFSDAADEMWDNVLDVVPDEIRADVETIKTGFDDIRTIGEKYDWNLLNEEAAAEFDSIDTTAQDEAGARFDAYLEDVCGITSFASADDVDDVVLPEPGDLTDEQIATSAGIVAQIFEIDIETAECLVEELGDISDPSAVDFARLDEPICGTTLNELLFSLGSE